MCIFHRRAQLSYFNLNLKMSVPRINTIKYLFIIFEIIYHDWFSCFVELAILSKYFLTHIMVDSVAG